MLILEVYPLFSFLKSPFNKLKMHKVGKVLKPREMLGLYSTNEIIFQIIVPVFTSNFCIVGSQKITQKLMYPLK